VSLPLNGNDIDERLAKMDVTSFIKTLGKSQSFSEVDGELRKTDQTAVSQLVTDMMGEDFTSDLANCTRPVMVVYGKKDDIVKPPQNNHQYNAAGSRFYVGLDDCAHFPMLENKVAFNRLLLEFIHSDDSLSELSPKEYWTRRVR